MVNFVGFDQILTMLPAGYLSLIDIRFFLVYNQNTRGLNYITLPRPTVYQGNKLILREVIKINLKFSLLFGLT